MIIVEYASLTCFTMSRPFRLKFLGYNGTITQQSAQILSTLCSSNNFIKFVCFLGTNPGLAAATTQNDSRVKECMIKYEIINE
jgi:thiamine pyrophosphokinase